MNELDRLYSARSAYKSQKRSYESERAAVREKLDRLKEAKRNVSNVKNNMVDPARDDISNKLGKHADTWQGTVYENVYEVHAYGIMSNYNNYYDDVDYILDAICDEITRLENENRHLGTLLNAVINTLNSIGNEIEKLLN